MEEGKEQKVSLSGWHILYRMLEGVHCTAPSIDPNHNLGFYAELCCVVMLSLFAGTFMVVTVTVVHIVSSAYGSCRTRTILSSGLPLLQPGFIHFICRFVI